MSTRTFYRRFPTITWIPTALLGGAVLTVVWTEWTVATLDTRLVRDGTVFIAIPLILTAAFGRDIGWRIDRTIIRNTVLLGLFVLPFYIVGSTLPTIRSFYPMWGLNSAAPAAFIPHALKQLFLVIAAETYYRGLLCVSVRDLGFKSVFISPIVYAVAHLYKPPIELLLSGPTDVLFGAVDYQSTSIIPSIVAHGGGLILLDWLVLHPPVIDPGTVLAWLSWLPVPL